MHFHTPKSSRQSAFTLIELLVSISIVAIMASIFFASMKGTQRAAVRSACANSMRGLSVATQLYAADNNGQLPISSEIGLGINQNTAWPGIIDKLGAYTDDKRVFFCPHFDRFQTSPLNLWSYNYQANRSSSKFANVSHLWLLSTGPSYWSGVATNQPVAGSGKRVLSACSNLNSSVQDGNPHDGNINYLFADGHVEAIKSSVKTIWQINRATMQFP